MYQKAWLAFVDIHPLKGKNFNDLIDLGDEPSEEYAGAWGNIIVLNDTINNVPDIVEAGLNELGMTAKFIDKIENIASLVEYDELDESVKEEVDWLLSSPYVFKISDKLFPYSE
jgi:hypothetical protein